MIGRAIGRVADRLLALSPAQWWMRERSADALTVFAYHDIDDPETFAGQVDWIVDHCRPVGLADVEAALHDGAPLPPRAALITFDDADRTIWDHGRAVLGPRGVPAVAFVVTDMLGRDEPFWWDEAEALLERGGRSRALDADPSDPAALVRALKALPDDRRREVLDDLRRSAREPAPRFDHLDASDLPDLVDAGIAVGSHSSSHPVLTRCTSEQVRAEIGRAHRALQKALGAPPTAFAYPNGDADGRAVECLRGLGYRVAFVFDHRRARPPVDDPLLVSRVRVGASTNPDRFAIIASGLHPAIHHRIGRS